LQKACEANGSDVEAARAYPRPLWHEAGIAAKAAKAFPKIGRAGPTEVVTARREYDAVRGCTEIALTTADGSQRIMLLHIAETWRRLAASENKAEGVTPHSPTKDPALCGTGSFALAKSKIRDRPPWPRPVGGSWLPAVHAPRVFAQRHLDRHQQLVFVGQQKGWHLANRLKRVAAHFSQYSLLH
jgi:hypothetical protein